MLPLARALASERVRDDPQERRRRGPLQRERRDRLGDILDVDVEPGRLRADPAQVRFGREQR